MGKKQQKENDVDLLIQDFFTEINPYEFCNYLSELTSDAMLGTPENNRRINSNRVTILSKTITFINKLNEFSEVN